MTFFISGTLVSALLVTTAAFAEKSKDREERRGKIEVREFKITQKLKTLSVENTSGSVTVEASDRENIRVESEKIGFGQGCNLSMSDSSKEVSIVNRAEGAFNTNECKVNLRILAPKKMALKIRNGSGDVIVNGENGGLTLRMGSGDAKLSGQFNFIDGVAGSGDVDIVASTGEIKFVTGSGDIEIKSETVPDKMNVEMESGSGDVEVRLPKGTKIWSRLRSGSGDAKNELGEAADALVRLDIKTGSGDIEIRAL